MRIRTNTDGDALGDVCDACPADPANDSDGDGVCGDVDDCPDVYNPNQMDTDGDGQGDECDSDDDNDNIPDESDNCRFDVNADQADSDGDGVGDVCDNCPADPNLDQADADADTFGDACDVCPAGDDRIDDDGDGVPNACDVCPEGNNSEDADMDGVPDACDVCPGEDDTFDQDGDGVPNCTDNCFNLPNPAQTDVDGDGSGPPCDQCDSDPMKVSPGVCGCGFSDLGKSDNDGDGFCAPEDCNDNNSDIRPNRPGENRIDFTCDGEDIDCSLPYGGCEPKTGCFGTCSVACGEAPAGCGVFANCGTCDLGFECFNGTCCLPTFRTVLGGAACGQRVDDGCGGTTVVTCGTGACVEGICTGTGGGCVPITCDGATCGADDGCGGTCPGTCPAGEQCLSWGIAYACTSITVTQCSNVQCGLCQSGSTFMDKSCPDGLECVSSVCRESSCVSESCSQLEECNVETGQCECCNTNFLGRTCQVCGDNEVCTGGTSGVNIKCCNIFTQLCF